MLLSNRFTSDRSLTTMASRSRLELSAWAMGMKVWRRLVTPMEVREYPHCLLLVEIVDVEYTPSGS